MSKIKQYIEQSVEKQVDKIILQVKQNLITKDTAINDILKIDNLGMVGVDENNVEEVIDMEIANA
jgi:hypothetical protein|tara:strand:+ start:122 stop:316 length:195 start_codon:yes stop_codon:yes gene_type:complete